MEKFLVINGGSSSLKFSLYEINNNEEKEIVNGYVEKIGLKDSFYSLKYNNSVLKKETIIKNHTKAVELMIEELLKNNFINNIDDIKGVGHRVLHGGEYYRDSVTITEEVLDNIKALIPLGPLHLPGEISAIESMIEVLPNVTQVAVFDTAFHQTMPIHNYLYALPYEYYEKYGIRKYGFHGTSHKYINEVMQKKLKKDNVNIISCHIGSGASICAIKDGKSLNTTMGFTPLDGLIMGTRSGAIDASIIEYICKYKNISVEECINILNKESGLKGISGISSDLRDIEKAKNECNEKASLAIDMDIKSIIKYIAQYYIELNGNIDALVFTAGVGENNTYIRKEVINALSNALKIELDEEENNKIAKYKKQQEGIITTYNSNFPVYVIPTNEEYMILKDTIRLSKENKNSLENKILSKGRKICLK